MKPVKSPPPLPEEVLKRREEAKRKQEEAKVEEAPKLTGVKALQASLGLADKLKVGGPLTKKPSQEKPENNQPKVFSHKEDGKIELNVETLKTLFATMAEVTTDPGLQQELRKAGKMLTINPAAVGPLLENKVIPNLSNLQGNQHKLDS